MPDIMELMRMRSHSRSRGTGGRRGGSMADFVVAAAARSSGAGSAEPAPEAEPSASAAAPAPEAEPSTKAKPPRVWLSTKAAAKAASTKAAGRPEKRPRRRRSTKAAAKAASTKAAPKAAAKRSTSGEEAPRQVPRGRGAFEDREKEETLAMLQRTYTIPEDFASKPELQQTWYMMRDSAWVRAGLTPPPRETGQPETAREAQPKAPAGEAQPKAPETVQPHEAAGEAQPKAPETAQPETTEEGPPGMSSRVLDIMRKAQERKGDTAGAPEEVASSAGGSSAGASGRGLQLAVQVGHAEADASQLTAADRHNAWQR